MRLWILASLLVAVLPGTAAQHARVDPLGVTQPEIVAPADSPRVSDVLEQSRQVRRSSWQLCRRLNGYEALSQSFEIEGARVGSFSLFPDSLFVRLRTTNSGLINAVWWWNPMHDGQPTNDWMDLLWLHRKASKAIANHTWLAEWRNASPGRLVELHAFSESVGETEFDLENFVMPVWLQAGFAGEPSYVVLARRGDTSWAKIYFGVDDSRALVTGVSEPDAETGHWLDGLEVYFHPRCEPDEDSERYVVVEPSGDWEIRTFAGCEP